MPAKARLLLLAGTSEARVLASRLAELPRIDAVASLAGATRSPAAFAVPVRTGGFGGADGLAKWLRAQAIAAVIDATHPFAARMPWNAAEACGAAGVPRLRLVRPEWAMRPGWVAAGSPEEAAAALPPGGRVLLTTGRDAAPFAARTGCRFWLRSIEPVDLPANISPIVARPPFAPDEEISLMRRLGITHLVSKNSGGDPAKLDAADALGATVVMIARPPQPGGPVAASVDAALDWLAATLGP